MHAKFLINTTRYPVKSRPKIHGCNVRFSGCVWVISYVRVCLLFLPTCGVQFGGHFMTFIVRYSSLQTILKLNHSASGHLVTGAY